MEKVNRFHALSEMDASKSEVECPIEIQLEISAARLESIKDQIAGIINSNVYDVPNIPGVQYYLSIYPNGNNEGRRGNVWIFLHLRLPKEKKIDAKFTNEVESADYSKFHKHTFEKSEGWGGFFCSTVDLFDPEKKFIVDEKLAVICYGSFTIEDTEKTEKWEGNNLGSILWNRDDKDFTIIVGGKHIQAHKLILAAQSPVFEAMLKSNMKESKEGKVKITDFPFDVVEVAVKLCYFNVIPNTLSFADRTLLLQFTDKYEMLDIKDNIEAALIKEITVSNVVKFANYSQIANAPKLEKKCIEFLVESLEKKDPVLDIDELDSNLTLELLQKSFCRVTKIA